MMRVLSSFVLLLPFVLLLASVGACSGSDTPPAADDAGASVPSDSSVSSSSDSSVGLDSASQATDAAPGKDSGGPSTGPSAVCAATIASFTACGGTIPEGTWKVATICSPTTSAARSPVCGPGNGTTKFYADGLIGIGELLVGAGSLGFSGVRYSAHYTSDGPKNCFSNNDDCRFTKGNLYGDAPIGNCTPQGPDCHCEWTAHPASQGSGSASFTTSGSTMTWFGRPIPYCVSGTKLTLDLAAVFAAEPIPPGTPLVATFEKK